MPVVAIFWLKLKVHLTFVVHLYCARCPSSKFYHYICDIFNTCVVKWGMLK
ncbi:hypothetical protein GLYMA_07G244834v4 [Glycine max]|nr:hypothetical protein GLYMA_07G244834v4 [Glycine max]KAH1088432.1 hypothetical protein GYH30_019460 [Glycine max]